MSRQQGAWKSYVPSGFPGSRWPDPACRLGMVMLRGHHRAKGRCGRGGTVAGGGQGAGILLQPGCHCRVRLPRASDQH